MKRSEERILATHVGGPPRPKVLTDLGRRLDGAPTDPGAYAHHSTALFAMEHTAGRGQP